MITEIQAGVLDGAGPVHEAAMALARSLGLPLSNAPGPDWRYALSYSPLEQGDALRLSLQLIGSKVPGPVYVDFCSGHHQHRRRFGGGRNQPLLRAIGIKPGVNPDVLDATGGLGRDAFVIASAGCRVRIVERSPVLAALLENGLQTAARDPDTAAITGRMSVQLADSTDYLQGLAPDAWPDTVYLDPMYPEREKSAQVKKEMQVLQLLLGKDTDSDTLLAIALRRCQKRVVVKRPVHATPLGGRDTDIHVSSKKTRYDIYLCRCQDDADAGEPDETST
jgi:16S rRNA (guanine1516-N2)-methyltransferase